MSGSRDFERLMQSMYPSSAPPTLASFARPRPSRSGPSDPSSLASGSDSGPDRLVRFIDAAEAASREYPPDKPELATFVPRPRPAPGPPRPARSPPSPPSSSSKRAGSWDSATTSNKELSSAMKKRKTSRETESQASTTSEDEKRPARKYKPDWKDLPYSNDYSVPSPFLSLPTNVLDSILSSPILTLRDHVSLASTARSLRSCYLNDSNLWRGLIATRPPVEDGVQVAKRLGNVEIAEKVYAMWTNRVTGDFDVIEGDGSASPSMGEKGKADGAEGGAIRSREWDEAINLVHSIRISKADAKDIYKLTEKELNTYLASFVPTSSSSGSSGKGGGGRTQVTFLESAVEALALRLHGGPLGHRDEIAQLRKKTMTTDKRLKKKEKEKD